jgi:predicted amidohydrolase
VVAGSVLERDGDALHNTIPVLGPRGDLLGTYRKANLFGYGSREAELLTPGDGPVVVDTPVGRLGLATCFDLRFPEHFAALRSMGADLHVVPAAWPAARSDHWDVLTRARAIETQTPLAACNGAGDCHGVELAGRSVICDASGVVLADAGAGPDLVTGKVDHDATQAWRTEFPIR